MDRRPPDRGRPGAPTGGRRKAERRAGIALAVAILAGVGLFVVYFAGGQTQVEGVLFAVAFGGFGVALGIWANHLLDAREVVEERHDWRPAARPAERFAMALTEEVGPVLGRRSMLLKLLAGAGGPLGLALLLPALSLGPAPGNTLKADPVAAGSRGCVNEEGEPRPASTRSPRTASLTVFPEGHHGTADAQALLIHVRPGSLKLPPEGLAGSPMAPTSPTPRSAPTPKLPVGLYRAESQSLICPLPPVPVRRVRTGPCRSSGPAARPCPSCRWASTDEVSWSPRATSPEPSGPAFWE